MATSRVLNGLKILSPLILIRTLGLQEILFSQREIAVTVVFDDVHSEILNHISSRIDEGCVAFQTLNMRYIAAVLFGIFPKCKLDNIFIPVIFRR